MASENLQYSLENQNQKLNAKNTVLFKGYFHEEMYYIPDFPYESTEQFKTASHPSCYYTTVLWEEQETWSKLHIK